LNNLLKSIRNCYADEDDEDNNDDVDFDNDAETALWVPTSKTPWASPGGESYAYV